jgi:serine/threonine-protein kinase
VADFGISKALHDNTQRVTKTGFVAGTYEFMSPEQVTGGEVDQRGDVYALGLIVFLMLTGKLPFPGETPEHSMLMRLTERPRLLRAMHPEGDWPNELQLILDKALDLQPSNRYDSAGQFTNALAQSIHQGEVSVGLPRGRAFGRAFRLGAALGLLALIVGGAALLLKVPSRRDTAAIVVAPDSLVMLDNGPQPTDSSEVVKTPEEPPSPVMQPELRASPPATRATRKKLPAPVAPEQGRRVLELYEDVLHADMPRDSALRALSSLDALLPQLKNARDSVDADLYRAEATALAGQSKEACTILDRARTRATELQRRKIELWVDQGICTAPDWTSS